jgi:adenylate cyclase
MLGVGGPGAGALGGRRDSALTRQQRAGTWSDSELEELYDINGLSAEHAVKTKHLLQMLKAIRRCNKSKRLDEAIEGIVDAACRVLGCDRATFFIVDEIRDDLVIRQGVGLAELRIPIGQPSLAGAVYKSGVKLNIPDAYQDARFNRSVDEASGYHTQSVLCAPVWDANYEPVAVLQAVNKLKPGGGYCAFTKEDEMLMDHLSMQLGVIVRNQMLLEESERSKRQVLSLLDIVRSLHSNMGANSLMFTVTERTPTLVSADRCTLYMVDRKHEELWSMQGAIEIRAPIGKGLIGYTAMTGQTINIEDAHKDERFNTEFDTKTGYRTKSVLVMPIKDRPQDREPEVIGVIQCINKLHAPSFTDGDEQLLGSFLDIVGSLLMTSQLFVSTSKQLPSEFGAALDIVSGQQTPRRSNSSNQLFFPDTIAEDGDDDEGDEGDDGDADRAPPAPLPPSPVRQHSFGSLGARQ